MYHLSKDNILFTLSVTCFRVKDLRYIYVMLEDKMDKKTY